MTSWAMLQRCMWAQRDRAEPVRDLAIMDAHLQDYIVRCEEGDFKPNLKLRTADGMTHLVLTLKAG